jgi:DNA-binding beta-propeller fold protein YncE
VINGKTGALTDDTNTVGTSPIGVAVDGSGTHAGLVYVTNYGDNTVSVTARVSASLGSLSASAGSAVMGPSMCRRWTMTWMAPP